VSGSGISWAMCKSAPRSRLDNHATVFYRTDALPAIPPTASRHWRHGSTPESHKNRSQHFFAVTCARVVGFKCILGRYVLQKVGTERWYNFPPRPISISALPCKTGNREIISFTSTALELWNRERKYANKTGTVRVRSKLKIQNSRTQIAFFKHQKLSTKSHILDADIQNLGCTVTLKCTVLYSAIP